MAQYVTKIRTEAGDLEIDYNALANKPQSDTTLTKSGSFADAKETGDAIRAVSESIGQSRSITWDDIDTTTAPGWYHISGSNTITDVTANYWYMHISAYGDGNLHCTQTLYPVGKTYSIHRTRTSEVFSEWERISATTAELNYVHGVTSNIQDQLNTISGQLDNKTETINEIKPDENGNINLVASDVGAAPNGYGLGKSQAITWDDIDTTTAPGWYHISGSNTIYDSSDTIAGITANYWYMHVSAWGDGHLHCTQTLYPVGKDYSVYRTCTSGMFGNWENMVAWLNSKANVDHEHSYLPISGGALTGTAAVSDAAVRNIQAGTEELTADSSALDTGVIYIQYE